MDTKIKSENKEEGIELLELLNIIKIKKRIVFISVGIAFVFALLFLILTPKEYKTQMSLLAESNSKGSASGILGQLGGLTGGNLGSLMGLDLSGSSGSEALTPDLYPNIVKSTTFLMEILEESIIEPESKKKMTVAEYLSDYTRPRVSGIPGYILNLIKSSDEEDFNFKKGAEQPLKLSLKQEGLVKALSGLIEVDVIKSGGGLTGGESKIINVSIEIQDPYLSAVLAELVVTNLKQYIINYNTGKAKQDLEFIEARYEEARDRYYKTQKALADYDDSNINVILASVRTNRQRLETENSLASSLYNGLAQKLEQSKIIVQDRTPVFTVIEPAKVPLRKSKPKASLILLGMLFMGVFAGVSIILGQEFIKSYSVKG